MPTRPLTQKDKPKDNKQILLDLISQQYGPSNTIVMEKALKTQDKQIEEAMTQGGMTANDIGKSIGIDLSSLGMPKILPAKGIFSPAQQTSEGNIQEGGALSWIGGHSTSDLLKKMLVLSQIQQKQPLSPESQIQTLTRTQDMLKKLGIKAKVDVTATGVPSLSTQPELGLAELPPDQQIQAVGLARKVAGVRGADRLIPSIVESLKSGKDIDTIEDELRFSGQSAEFSGALRSAAQQIMVGQSTAEKQGTFDDLDDLSGDPEQQREYLKRMAIKNSSVTQQQNVMGQERTIDLLSEIKGDLETLEREGFPTGFWSGNIENLMGKVGQVRNPKHRELATKVAVAVMQYRRDMTGVQFGMKEHAEYKSVFPNINKVGRFNMSAIKGLTDTFKGNINKFYAQSMGNRNYKEIFGNGQAQEKQQNDNSILNRLGLDPNRYEIVR